MNTLFDTPLDRRNSGSYKWDTTPEDTIPMWVADMDFRTAQPIIDALQKRVEHGAFGYTAILPEYYSAIREWFLSRYGWEIKPSDNILYTSGVVPAISAIIKALAPAGSRVVLQTPAYNCFFSSIRNNGCLITENPLLRRESEPGVLDFTFDFKALENLFLKGDVSLMILCNPHNPTGRIWTVEELSEIATLAARHSVTVISDEIHCDITLPGLRYNPFAPIAEAAGCRYVICSSPSKTFNTAGLQIANIVTPLKGVADLIDRAININEICDVNPFGPVALVAAYTRCAPWLEQLREYISGNFRLLRKFLTENRPEWKISRPEATYLAWIEVDTPKESGSSVAEEWLSRGVRIASGDTYGESNFIRINLACPRETLNEALRRIY